MSQKYNEHKSLNFPELASEILSFWKEEKIFEKSVDSREGNPSFTFYEGPPSANGTPGIHHDSKIHQSACYNDKRNCIVCGNRRH